jgi:peptidyl-prolyl cis-trans isomerase D
MLQAIRKRQKFLLTVFISLISIVFIFWGFYGDFGRSLSPTEVASVNGKKITVQEFQNNYQNTLQMYQNILKDKFTPEMENQFNLKQVTLNELIDQRLVVSGAEKLELKTTDTEVRDQLTKLPYFQKEGKFDKDLYLSLLKANRITPQDFENNIRTDLLRRKVITLLRSQVKVSPDEVLKDYVLKNDKVNIQFIQINPDALGSRVSVTSEQIEEFSKKGENLKRAQNYYINNSHLYKIKKSDGTEKKTKPFDEVKSEILQTLLTEDQRIKLAKELTDELWRNRNNKGFEKILKKEKLSWDETGLFPRNTKFIPKIGEAPEIMDHAFGLKPGAFFDRPLILKNRFYTLKIKERQPADPKKFDEKQELQTALNQKQYDAYTQWLRDLRASAKIKIQKRVLNPEEG